MKVIEKPLNFQEIKKLQNEFGEYLKLTIDTENKIIVAGGKLHADGEKILLEQGSKQENVWGGGIDLINKETDTTAVLNYRPNMNNPSMEILDQNTRQKFANIVKYIFSDLWG